MQVFGISSALATEILWSCAEPAVWKYRVFNFLILQCLSWYSSVATLHPIINFCFWHNRQGAHKPYRVSCSLCSYITWLCLHDETCDITGVTTNLWYWLHNAVLFPHQCFDCFAFVCYVCFYHCVLCTIGSCNGGPFWQAVSSYVRVFLHNFPLRNTILQVYFWPDFWSLTVCSESHKSAMVACVLVRWHS